VTYRPKLLALLSAIWFSSLLAADFPSKNSASNNCTPRISLEKTTVPSRATTPRSHRGLRQAWSLINSPGHRENPKPLQEAAALDVKFKQTGKFVGPLHGVPVIIKDNVDVLGMPIDVRLSGLEEFHAVE